MGITPRFKQSDILKETQKGLRTIENGIIRILQYGGEKFVKDARDENTYIDQTGNLRSSIGYFILKDGKVIDSMIYLSAKGTDRQTGLETGKLFAGTLPKSSGYQLIGVAGMDYASSVESKGYNVITLQKDVCLVKIETDLNRFKTRMNAKDSSVDFDINDLVLTATR